MACVFLWAIVSATPLWFSVARREWMALAVIAAVTVALVALFVWQTRPGAHWLRLDEDGFTLRRYWRTTRIGWHEIDSVAAAWNGKSSCIPVGPVRSRLRFGSSFWWRSWGGVPPFGEYAIPDEELPPEAPRGDVDGRYPLAELMEHWRRERVGQPSS